MSGEQAFEGWAILELMGHRVRGGYVKDVEMFGGKLLRIDIPVGDKPEETVTEFYGCGSVYSLRPCAEGIVRDHVKKTYGADPRPVMPVNYRIEDRSRAAESADHHDDEE